jgi:aminobenzoyl-glutamate transport protein
MTITLSAFYGFVAGRFAHLHDLYQALLDGVRAAAPLLLFYILLVQLWESLRYVIS